ILYLPLVEVFLREIGGERFVGGVAVFAACFKPPVSARCVAVSLVRNEPVLFILNVPVALASTLLGGTTSMTVGTGARDARALSSSMTFGEFLEAASSDFFGNVESLKRACSATLMRNTVGELKNVFR